MNTNTFRISIGLCLLLGFPLGLWAQFTRLDASFKQLFRRTEQALHDAKSAGGNTIRVLEQKLVFSLSLIIKL